MASRSSQGKVPAPETKLSAAFPQYADLLAAAGPRAGSPSAHVLSMTVDMDWDELTIPYGDPRNSENAMEAAPDRYRYVLERPILGPPGVKWTYNGGCTTLLARLIAEGTGEKLHAYARRVLFDLLELRSQRMGDRAAMATRSRPRACACYRATCRRSAAWC